MTSKRMHTKTYGDADLLRDAALLYEEHGRLENEATQYGRRERQAWFDDAKRLRALADKLPRIVPALAPPPETR